MKQRRRIYYSAAQRSDAGEAEAESAQTLIGDTLPRHTLERPVADLDLHERQFVEIARALTGARLLLLDEPTANLTFAETERLFGILRRLANSGEGAFGILKISL
jgi:ribose transport system ATP-binding protein